MEGTRSARPQKKQLPPTRSCLRMRDHYIIAVRFGDPRGKQTGDALFGIALPPVATLGITTYYCYGPLALSLDLESRS